MPEDPEEPLSPSLAASLAALRREEPPPPAVETRLLRDLHAAGLLSGRPRFSLGRLWTASRLPIAAALAAFLLGAWLGPRLDLRRAAGASLPRYVLFLYQTPALEPTPQARAARVAEYSAWAREIRKAGHLVAGEKLADQGAVLEGPGGAPRAIPAQVGPDTVSLSGYFVIQAATWEEALTVARACPHLRHGGSVALRPIDPV
jgi:hypothetical protein